MYFIFIHHLAVSYFRRKLAAPAKEYFSAFQLLEISQFCFLNADILKVMYLTSLTESVLPVISFNFAISGFFLRQSCSYLSYI